MPCVQGNRENIDKAKEYYRKQKEHDPVRELWTSLVHRVHETDEGFDGLTPQERTYFALCILDGEVYNGGMHQFFSNSSGEYYSIVVDGLLELRAFECLRLLNESRELLFDDGRVPADREERYSSMKEYPDEGADTTEWCIRLNQIDKEYWDDPDRLGEKLNAYAESHGLTEPFKNAN